MHRNDVVRLEQDGNGDYYVKLPDGICASLGWELGDAIEIEVVGQSLVLRKVAPK